MNERIRQLADEAKKYAAKKYALDAMIKITDKEQALKVYSESYDTKFAELIVQECVSTVEGMSPGYQDYRNQIEDAFRRDCVIEIKHKFGVE
jgi:hypothetical protein